MHALKLRVDSLSKFFTKLFFKNLKILFSLSIIFMVLPSNAQFGFNSKLQLECKHLDIISEALVKQHLLFKTVSPELVQRTAKQFVKRLDPFELYLIDNDEKVIKSNISQAYKKIKKGDCSLIDKSYDLYEKRVKERLAFVKRYLSKNFKMDPNTKLIIDPDDRARSKSLDEAYIFHKKYIQFQMSSYLSMGQDMEKAKANVIKKYNRAITKIGELKKEERYSSYLDSFAKSLDPHSNYFSAKALEEFQIGMRLELEGIGASLSSEDGFTTIEELITGGAALKSGLLKSQDKIIAVGQYKGSMALELENVVDWDLSDVVRKIRGKKGTRVRLQILRKDAGKKAEKFLVTLTRDKVNLDDQAASLSVLEKKSNGIKRKIGVINLPSFYADSRRGGRSSSDDVKDLLKDAKAKKVDGILLDLSSNGGGSLDDAVKLAGLFFKTGNVVKQASPFKHKDQETILRDVDSAVDWAGPLVLLTSRVSASASEIVAGVLKDYKRALIVGADQTFGKGSIQQVVPLPPGLGAIKVTMGMFFTPSGHSTQHRGVGADVILPSALSNDEIGEKTLDYSLPPKKVADFVSPDAYVKKGAGKWNQVNPSTITILGSRSKVRVSKSEKFKEVFEDIEKVKKTDKYVIVSDSMKEQKERKTERKEKKNWSKDKKKAEYLKTADLDEAAEVLVDLIDLDNKVRLVDLAQKAAANN